MFNFKTGLSLDWLRPELLLLMLLLAEGTGNFQRRLNFTGDE